MQRSTAPAGVVFGSRRPGRARDRRCSSDPSVRCAHRTHRRFTASRASRSSGRRPLSVTPFGRRRRSAGTRAGVELALGLFLCGAVLAAPVAAASAGWAEVPRLPAPAVPPAGHAEALPDDPAGINQARGRNNTGRTGRPLQRDRQLLLRQRHSRPLRSGPTVLPDRRGGERITRCRSAPIHPLRTPCHAPPKPRAPMRITADRVGLNQEPPRCGPVSTSLPRHPCGRLENGVCPQTVQTCTSIRKRVIPAPEPSHPLRPNRCHRPLWRPAARLTRARPCGPSIDRKPTKRGCP